MGKLRKKKNVYMLVAFAAVIVIVIAAFFFSSNKKESITSISMNSAVTVTLYERNSLMALIGNEENLCFKAVRRIKAIDEETLDWRNEASQCALFNSFDDKENGFEADDDFLDITDRSLRLAEMTDGAVDMSIRNLISVWNIEDSYGSSDYQPPSDSDVAKAAASSGYKNVHIMGGRIFSDEEELGLDFGAFGKGYALDKVYLEYMKEKNVRGGVIGIGGSILVFGEKPHKENFEVGIRDPEGGVNDILGFLSWRSAPGEEKLFISTSGSYERYARSLDGRVYSHIIDSGTNAPVETDLISVTVAAPEGIVSDGLSTACFVMGPEKSESILKSCDAEGIFVYADHSIYVTEGLSGRFVLSSDDYFMKEGPK